MNLFVKSEQRFSSGLAAVLLVILVPVLVSAQDSDKCVTCHEKMTPGIVGQWNNSLHSEAGVSCLDCHAADPSEVDAFKHGGTTIAIIRVLYRYHRSRAPAAIDNGYQPASIGGDVERLTYYLQGLIVDPRPHMNAVSVPGLVYGSLD